MTVAMGLYESLKRFWIRRKYQRLGFSDTTRRKRTLRLSRLGGRRWRFWRIQVIPRVQLRLKLVSPKRLLARLRDYYVDGMLRLSRSGGFLGDTVGFPGRKSASAGQRMAVDFHGDMEKRVLYELYRTLVASQRLNCY